MISQWQTFKHAGYCVKEDEVPCGYESRLPKCLPEHVCRLIFSQLSLQMPGSRHLSQHCELSSWEGFANLIDSELYLAFSLACVHMLVCGHVCVLFLWHLYIIAHAHEQMCEARGGPQHSVCHSRLPSCEAGSLPEPRARPVAGKPKGVSNLYLPWCWGWVGDSSITMPGFLHEYNGFELKSSFLYSKCSYPLSPLQSFFPFLFPSFSSLSPFPPPLPLLLIFFIFILGREIGSSYVAKAGSKLKILLP